MHAQPCKHPTMGCRNKEGAHRVAPSLFDSIAAYFSRKHPNYTLYLGDFSGKHPNYTLYLGGFLRKHPNYTPYLGGFGYRKKPIASAFKNGCDDFLLHCIWERERRKRGDRYLLQAVDIVLRHLGTAFAIHTCRNDATGIACSFATREKSPQAHVLQGFAVA